MSNDGLELILWFLGCRKFFLPITELFETKAGGFRGPPGPPMGVGNDFLQNHLKITILPFAVSTYLISGQD